MLHNQSDKGPRRNQFTFWKMDIDSHVNKVQKFVLRGNFHAALNIALSGLNECRRNDDQAGVDNFLGIIDVIAKTLAHEFGSREYLGR